MVDVRTLRLEVDSERQEAHDHFHMTARQAAEIRDLDPVEASRRSRAA